MHLCYRKKPTGDILLSDKSSQKFWHAIPVTAPILNGNSSPLLVLSALIIRVLIEDISVSYPLEIRGLPVAKVCIAIDRSAVEAFLAVVNAAACPNSSTLPTIVNLQSLIRKLAKYSVYNGRAFVSGKITSSDIELNHVALYSACSTLLGFISTD